MFDTGKKNGNNLQNGHRKMLKNCFYLRENGQFSSESPSSASFTEYSSKQIQFLSSTNLKEFNGLRLEITRVKNKDFENRPDVASLPQKSLQKTLLGLEKLK